MKTNIVKIPPLGDFEPGLQNGKSTCLRNERIDI